MRPAALDLSLAMLATTEASRAQRGLAGAMALAASFATLALLPTAGAKRSSGCADPTGSTSCSRTS